MFDKEISYAICSMDELEEKGIACGYHILTDGVNPYTGETEIDYINAGYAVLTEEEFDAAIKAHEDSLIGHWHEETEEEYDNALNVLLPMKWHDGGFYVREAYTSNIYAFHQEYKGKFYTSLQRSNTPREKILESLLSCIK